MMFFLIKYRTQKITLNNKKSESFISFNTNAELPIVNVPTFISQIFKSASKNLIFFSFNMFYSRL